MNGGFDGEGFARGRDGKLAENAGYRERTARITGKHERERSIPFRIEYVRAFTLEIHFSRKRHIGCNYSAHGYQPSYKIRKLPVRLHDILMGIKVGETLYPYVIYERARRERTCSGFCDRNSREIPAVEGLRLPNWTSILEPFKVRCGQEGTIATSSWMPATSSRLLRANVVDGCCRTTHFASMDVSF